MLQRSRNTANNNTGSSRNSNSSNDLLGTAAAAAPGAAAARPGPTTNAGRRRRLVVRPRSERHERTCLVVLFAAGLLCVVHVLSSASTTFLGWGRTNGEPGVPSLSLDFQGTSRTSDEKPRIAIVSNAVAFPYSDVTTAQWSLFKEYFANKDCYAKSHGYDLIIDSR